MDSIIAVVVYIIIKLSISTVSEGVETKEAAKMNIFIDIGVLIVLIIVLITLVISDNF